MNADGVVLEQDFQEAAKWLRNNHSLKLTTEQKLKIYGLYKQSIEGKCTTSKPGVFDISGRSKWEAWNRLGTMSPADAMTQYLELVTAFDPNWKSKSGGAPSSGSTGGRGGTGGGPVVSTLMDEDEALDDESKTIFDWCKENDIPKLVSMITTTNLNSRDEQGMSLLHWACDRGNLEVAQMLVEKGADVNIQDLDLQTPLHYAAFCGHPELVTYLLTLEGTNKELCDCDGYKPSEVTVDPIITLLFD